MQVLVSKKHNTLTKNVELSSWNTDGLLKMYHCKHSSEIKYKKEISLKYIVHSTMDGCKFYSQINIVMSLHNKGWLELLSGLNQVTFKEKMIF